MYEDFSSLWWFVRKPCLKASPLCPHLLETSWASPSLLHSGESSPSHQAKTVVTNQFVCNIILIVQSNLLGLTVPLTMTNLDYTENRESSF